MRGSREASRGAGALIAWLILAALGPLPVTAAGAPGTLRGVVRDPSGGVVPGARVELSRGTQVRRSTTTDRLGIYRLPGLEPGAYSLLVTRDGFSPYGAGAIDIAAGQDLSFDVELAVAPVERSMTVEDQGRDLSLTPRENQGAIVIQGQDLEALPDDPDELAEALQALAGPAAGPSGGQLYIDGLSGGRLPSKSSIREIRINANPFSAEYDRLGFGRIEVFTRPGTEKLHAMGSFRFNDESLNTRDRFAASRIPFQRRDWNGDLSGPIKTGTASFVVDLDRRDTDDNDLVNATVLDPSLDPVRIEEAVLTPRTRTSFEPRVDWQIAPSHTLSLRYEHETSDDPVSGVGGFSLPSRAYARESREDSLAVIETAAIGKLANETRFRWSRSEDSRNGDPAGPALDVLDAFTGGGSQVGRSSSVDRSWEVQNVTTFAKGAHSVRAGARLRGGSQVDVSRRNYGGTVTFSGGMGPQLDALDQVVPGPGGQPVLVPLTSLERYRRTVLFQGQGLTPARVRELGGGASRLQIAGGDPEAKVTQWDVGPFVQDDWKLGEALVLSLGLRYERQASIDSSWNLAPRLGFAWSPGTRKEGEQSPATVIRGGFGVFYDRVGQELTLAARREDGRHQLQYQVTDPTILDLMSFTLDSVSGVPSVEDLADYAVPLATRVVDPAIQAPRTVQASLSLERQLPGGFTFTGTYIDARGRRQLRSRNINAPRPDGSRPLGEEAGTVYAYESTGRSEQQQLILGANNRFGRRFSVFARYFLSWARSDTDGPGSFPADGYDLAAEYGTASSDLRHRFVLGGNLSVPWGIRFNPFLLASSGRPFNITTGRDGNGDTLFTDRPAYATDPTRPGVVDTPYGLLDPEPEPGAPIIPRNLGRGPGFFTLNLRLSKTIPLGKQPGTDAGDTQGPRHGGGPGGPWGGMRGRPGRGGGFGTGGGEPSLTLSVSAHNLFNTVNLAPPVGSLASPLFGRSTATAGGFGFGPARGGRGGGSGGNRRVELQARVSF